MTVFGPVIDEQKNTCQRKTFYQAIEKCLSFAVDPMQVLKNQYSWLPLALTDEHPLYRLEGVSTPLLWLHRKVSFHLVGNVFGLHACCRRMNFVRQRAQE